MIATAIYFVGGKTSPQQADDTTSALAGDTSAINPITADDHIRGNPNAPIIIVEYSDLECPWCRVFHDTMKKIIDEYGTGGQVAWVYRQLPLQQLHPNAPTLALASECVAGLGGNDAFWKFTDALNESRQIHYVGGQVQSVDPTDMNKLNDFVAAAGVNQTDFEQCVQNGTYQDKVEEDFNNAIAMTGGKVGTPYNIIMVGGEQGVINGAQSYETVKGIIDNLLGQLKGETVQQQ